MVARVKNAGQKDCAQMWFGPDFRGSLKVQAMSWAEQGMYRHLLDLAWENGGIPADLADVRGILGLSRRAFDVAWKRIGQCFEPHPEDPATLVNVRQEKERAIRAGIRAKRAEAGIRGNSERWQTDRNGIANASQNPRLSPSPSPSPPQSPSSPNEEGNPSPVPSEARGARVPESEGGIGDRGRPEGAEQLFAELQRTTVRSRSKNRRVALSRIAASLHSQGMSAAELRSLWARSRQESEEDPGGLLLHWLENGWREKVRT